MQDYRKLEVWKKSHELTLDVYRATEKFPKEEIYGLTSQIRRSASSIPSNLAEGCGRNTKAQLITFTSYANGSAFELDYRLLLARDLDFLKVEEYDDLCGKLNKIMRMLNGFMQRLESPQKPITKNQQPKTQGAV